MTIKERIEIKKTELMKIFSALPEKQLTVATDLINQAAFMAVTLEDLSEKISINGTVEEYTNGANQSGRKISSDAKLYGSLIAKYTAITTKLLKLIPEEKQIEQPSDIKRMMASQDQESSSEKQLKRKQMEDAFLDAVRKGDIKQVEYREFCKKWENNQQ